MRKTFLIAVFPVLLICAQYASGAHIDITDLNVFAGSVTKEIRWGSTVYWQTGTDMAVGLSYWSSSYYYTRSFAEFNLSPWYSLGLSSDAITQIDFIANFKEEYAIQTYINVYAMNALEDGALSPNLSNYDVSVTGLYGGIPKYQYDPQLVRDVTIGILPDIETGQTWSGISVRSTNENNMEAIAFYGETSVPGMQPILRIYYDEPAPSVPEPATIFLLGIASNALFRIKRHF